MDYFLKRYIEVCKKGFTQYGFKRRGNNFVRVVNDVMQNFYLHRSMSGWSCTIKFGMLPLCKRIEKTQIMSGVGLYNLKWFESSKNWQNYNDWEYDRHSEKSMDACIHEMAEYIHKYLIPFFKRANDSAKAYQALCTLEKETFNHFYRNGIIMFDYSKYCMALKISDYDAAIAHLKAIEQQNMDAFNFMNESGYITKEYEKNVQNQLKKIRKEIELVTNQDEQYIKNFIQDNEAYSLSNLKGLT